MVGSAIIDGLGGKRLVIGIAAVTAAIMPLASAFSPTIGVLAILRFFLGFAIGVSSVGKSS